MTKDEPLLDTFENPLARVGHIGRVQFRVARSGPWAIKVRAQHIVAYGCVGDRVSGSVDNIECVEVAAARANAATEAANFGGEIIFAA